MWKNWDLAKHLERVVEDRGSPADAHGQRYQEACLDLARWLRRTELVEERPDFNCGCGPELKRTLSGCPHMRRETL